jgi:hypothetical protein
MSKFVLVYLGGTMAESPAEQEAVMQKWMGWFDSIGPSILDGGNPFAGSTAVSSNGRSDQTKSQLTGYSIVEAESLDAAASLVEKCPVLESGGSVEIFEAIPM